MLHSNSFVLGPSSLRSPTIRRLPPHPQSLLILYHKKNFMKR
jgi:hypothetical protein